MGVRRSKQIQQYKETNCLQGVAVYRRRWVDLGLPVFG